MARIYRQGKSYVAVAVIKTERQMWEKELGHKTQPDGEGVLLRKGGNVTSDLGLNDEWERVIQMDRWEKAIPGTQLKDS